MNTNIYQQFLQTAKHFSDKTAVVSGNDSYSYKDLLLYSDSIASNLQDYITPGEKVGVIYDRNHELIALILGILRIGACYVPIDPRYPQERIEYMVDDASITTIVCTAEFQSLVPENVKSITFDDFTTKMPNTKPIIHELDTTGNDLAYVMYTSGTSQSPKSVMVQNHCVPMLLASSIEQGIKFDSNDKWTMFHSYAFDFSIWEIFGAILTGATLHIIDDKTMGSIDSFYEYLQANQISMLSLTPSVFKQLLKIMAADSLPDLRYIVFGGERFDLNDYQQWLQISPNSKANLINMYGITETTVHATLHFLHPEDINKYNNESPIGVPLKHFDIFLLDNNLQPVKDGETGEIYVAGNALAQGYLNKPDVTAARFLSVPKYLNSKYTCMYKSGDLAAKVNGILCSKGRSDNQIKFRGYRIQLDEIEKAILEMPTVKNSAAFIDNSSGLQTLVAFYDADSEFNRKQIKNFLNKSLPDYMLPDKITYLEKIPVNINGKVNKVELRKIYRNNMSSVLVNNPSILPCYETTYSNITWAGVKNLSAFLGRLFKLYRNVSFG